MRLIDDRNIIIDKLVQYDQSATAWRFLLNNEIIDTYLLFALQEHARQFDSHDERLAWKHETMPQIRITVGIRTYYAPADAINPPEYDHELELQSVTIDNRPVDKYLAEKIYNKYVDECQIVDNVLADI